MDEKTSAKNEYPIGKQRDGPPPSSILSDEAIQSFKKNFLEEYGEEITDEEAAELGLNLLTFIKYVHRPIKREWLEEFEKINEMKNENGTTSV